MARKQTKKQSGKTKRKIQKEYDLDELTGLPKIPDEDFDKMTKLETILEYIYSYKCSEQRQK